MAERMITTRMNMYGKPMCEYQIRFDTMEDHQLIIKDVAKPAAH